MAAALLATTPTLAQPSEPASRSTARKLANEGLALVKKGDYATALEKFNLADSLVAAPSVAIEAARCLEKLGRLVEASERYVDVLRAPVGVTSPPAFRKAQREAAAEREELLPRIPTLVIRVQGPMASGVRVTLDGKTIPLASVDAPRAIDPGKHTISVTRDDITVTDRVNIAERESAIAKLVLPPLPPPPPPPEEPGKAQRTWGFVALGAGGVGLVTASVAGAVALGLQADLFEVCDAAKKECAPPYWGKNDAYNAARYITTAGFVLAGVGAGAGLALLLTAPSRKKDEPSTKVSLRIGPGAIGFEGVF